MRVFVIRGFGVKKDSAGQLVDFERVHDLLIAPALKRCGLDGGTTAEVIDAGNIRADMFALILEADVVVCDITVHNANVFYELGIRHALRKKHTVLIKGDPSADTTPFDLSTDRYLRYEVADPAATLDQLVATLQASIWGSRETDSPVFLMLPSFKEANPGDVMVVPLDLIEEVQRAQKAGDKAWLRVIAEDLLKQRFEREGLRCVARAQWKLKDYSDARTNWERVLVASPHDIEANLALANIYERLHRSDGRETWLEKSNQAISRVLQSSGLKVAVEAEALGLQGRNLKSAWRTRLNGVADPLQALKLALDARVRQSYESYRRAFECDLNAFYPGVAALQMGHILLQLADLPEWRNLFKGNAKQAGRAREDLQSEIPALASVVQASVDRSIKLEQGSGGGWAQIAAADLQFLKASDGNDADEQAAVVQAYRDAFAAQDEFAWDATRGQLQLFAQLGIRVATAEAVIQALDRPSAKPTIRHLVVFAGHTIDLDGARLRFPAVAEGLARQKITEQLQGFQAALDAGEELLVLASAAPGADLITHEVCKELRISCRLCLPMPADAIAQLVFPEADQWRTRFWKVVEAEKASLLQLEDQAELPRWLQGRAGVDVWERGNRWMMQMAQVSEAKSVRLLVVWDGHDDPKTGGTAHMVRLAKSLPKFSLDVIDSRQFLS
ncbi:MAG: tetratricopeptide repeat-containing protein [Pseudomarimonas sp.]